MNSTVRRAITWRKGLAAFLALILAALLTILGASLASAASPSTSPTALIDAGGPSVSGWLADSTDSPSSDLGAGQTTYTATTTHAIDMSSSTIPAGTPASIFQTERWSAGSSLDYNVPATTATSTVRLFFAENYSGAQAAGARLMNVVINGVTVDKNLDVYSLVGGYAGLVRTYTVASPGPIAISITNPDKTNSPHLMGLTVTPVSGSTTDTAPPTTASPTSTTPTTTTPTTSTTTTPATTTTTTGTGNTKAGLATALSCPASSVQVAPGNVPGISANTNYCFASGTYSGFNVTPKSGDGFYGGEHAVLDGGGSQTSAFATGSSITDLIIDGFTMQDYSSSATDQVPGVVELQNGSDVTVSDNTIDNDRTSAVSWGNNTGAPCCVDYTAGVSHGTITHNLITNIGYSGTTVSGGTDDTISYNDVSDTDTDNVDTEITVAAVGKFAVDDGTVVEGNYIHNNNDTAMWFDDYNTNSMIKDNTVGPDNRVGIFYEISVNAVITDNTITDNGQADAGEGTGAPGAAIRISSSGSSLDPPSQNASSDGPQSITISDNTLTYNHEGITLFDGHTNNDGTPIYDNNITVTGNSTVGDNTSTASDSDAWLAHTAPTGHNIVWSNNTYKAGSSSESPGYFFALNTGSTGFAGWQGNGLDTSGSSCETASGGSC
jgi:hypothetical protein